MASRRIHGIAIAALVAAALSIAACGSSSSSTSAPAASSGSQAASSSSTAKGTPLKVMVVATVNSPASSWPDIPAAAQAAAKAINVAGGIQGHPLQVVFCDEQFDPNRAGYCARQAVSDHVVADVGNLDYYAALTLPILSAAGIPDVGQFATTKADYQSPDSFPLNTGAAGEFAAIPAIAASQGAKSLSAVMYDNAAAKEQIAPLQGASKVAGLQYRSTVLVPQTATDFSPYVQSLKSSGSAVIAQVLSTRAALQLLQAGSQIGLGAKWMNPSLLGPNDAASASGLASGVIMPAPLPPYTATQFPAIKQFDAEMDAAAKAGITGTNNRRVAAINTWLAVHAFAKVAGTITAQITSSSVKQALQHAKGINLYGLQTWSPATAGPKAFPRVSNPNIYETEVKGTQIMLAAPAPINVFHALGLG